MGGSLTASETPTTPEIKGTALARHWKALLALIADVTLRPALPPAEIDNERRGDRQSGIKNRRSTSRFRSPTTTMMGRIFRSHPYGAPSRAGPPPSSGLDRQALAEALRSVLIEPGRIIVRGRGQGVSS